ncbi:hypothetical protein [uncultured Lactobacillus sp.]|uniref:hypothetical protein n=1 Tax=uncultured Lactobacillus sp. TaxID=153152 RepID=UPI0026251DFC|nr:hypothetical protein [uncultured Lactobacillus sp.]
MTIKEFLADGGRINARWDFTDFASHEVDQSNSTENFSSVDDIVQDAIEQGSFSENQEFNRCSETFDLYDSDGNELATDLDEAEANSFIANL